MEKIIKQFDGKLTEEEKVRLKNADFDEKDIVEIENFLYKYREYLTGFYDLVGDDLIPTKQFIFNMKHIGNLLDKDPNKVLSKVGLKLRGLTTARLVRLLGQNFMTSKQVFENRNELTGKKDKNGNYLKDNGITLPKDSAIWVSNHHFKDDALASVRAAKRPVVLMFGSIPLYFNTTDGILAFLIGSILINRKVKLSKQASIPKAVKALEYGSDLLWYPEASHNKTPNRLLIDLWNGVYRVANESGKKVIPAVHYIFDPTQKIIPHDINLIHTVVDDPIDLTQFSEKAGLEYLRDVMATWYYLMMEKYGKMIREELLSAYRERAYYYGASQEMFNDRQITANEIAELYNMDLRSTVSGYDRLAEINAGFNPKEIVLPEEAFENISKIKNINSKNVWDVVEASTLIRQRKLEDYQKRF